MDIPSVEEVLALVSQLPGPLILLGVAMGVGIVMLLLVSLLGMLRGRGVQKNVKGVPIPAIVTSQVPQTALPSALEELTEQEAISFLSNPFVGTPNSALAIKLYRIVKEKTQQPFLQNTTERFLILLSPPIDAKVLLKINGQLIQEQRGSGIWEYLFSSVGTVQLSAEISGSFAIWSTVIQIVEGGQKIGFDLSRVKISVTKPDGIPSTVVYQSDYYFIQVDPNYPVKVNLMVDDVFYQSVEGSQYVQVHFTDEGEHTLYAVVDQDKKIASSLCKVDVRASNEAGPEDVGEQEEEQQQEEL